jgi:hypothetical protein
MSHTRVLKFEEFEQVLLSLTQGLTKTADQILAKLNALDVAKIIKGFAGGKTIDDHYCDTLLKHIANQCWKEFGQQMKDRSNRTIFSSYQAQCRAIEQFSKDVQHAIRSSTSSGPEGKLLEGLVERATSARNYFGIPQITVATGRFFLRWSLDLLSPQSSRSLSETERQCLQSMNDVLVKDTGSDLVMRIASIVSAESQTPVWEKMMGANLHATKSAAKPTLEVVLFQLSLAQFRYSGADPEAYPLADIQAASLQVQAQFVSTHAAALAATGGSSAVGAAAVSPDVPSSQDGRVAALLSPGGAVVERLKDGPDQHALLVPKFV